MSVFVDAIREAGRSAVDAIRTTARGRPVRRSNTNSTQDQEEEQSEEASSRDFGSGVRGSLNNYEDRLRNTARDLEDNIRKSAREFGDATYDAAKDLASTAKCVFRVSKQISFFI